MERRGKALWYGLKVVIDAAMASFVSFDIDLVLGIDVDRLCSESEHCFIFEVRFLYIFTI